MKILQTCQEYYPLISGPTKQTHNLSQHLIRRGIEAPVLTTNAGTNIKPGPDQIDGVPIYRLQVKGRIMRCYFVPTLHRDLDLTGVDVVHVHGWRNYLSEFVMHRARRHKVPVVLHAHGAAGMPAKIISGVSQLPYWAYDVVRRKSIIDGTDLLIVSTNQERDEAIAYGFSANTIAVIPAGVDQLDVSPRQPMGEKSDEPIRLLFVGRLARDRNLEQIVRAVAALRDRQINVTLRIVGAEERRTSLDRPGYVESMKSLVSDLNLNEIVTFTGEQRGKELNDEYATADLFVSTSRYENFGIALLEAAAHGLPLVVTPTGVGTDLVAATGAGVVVPIDDVSATANAISHYVANPRMRVHLGETLQSYVADHYSWTAIGKLYLDLYQELCER